MTSPDPGPTAQPSRPPSAEEVGRVLAWAIGHKKTVGAIVVCLVGVTSAGATTLYQRQRQADEVAALKTTVQQLRTTVVELEERVRKVEAGAGVLEMLVQMLAKIQTQLSDVAERLARLEGRFDHMPSYETSDARALDSRQRSPHPAAAGRP